MNNTRIALRAALVAALSFVAGALVTGSAFAAPADDLSIAFLPAAATTDHAGGEAGGLAAAVATALAGKDKTIRVVTGEAKPGEKLADTASTLKVRFIWEAEVGGTDAYKVDVTVTDAKTGAVIMKSSYFSDEDNIPTLPGEMASGLLTALKAAKL